MVRGQRQLANGLDARDELPQSRLGQRADLRDRLRLFFDEQRVRRLKDVLRIELVAGNCTRRAVR